MSESLAGRQALVHSCLDAIAPLLITDGAGLVLDANKRFCDLLGLDAPGLKGSDVRAFLLEGGDGPVRPSSKREAQFISRSGFTFWLELSVFPFPEGVVEGKEAFLWIGFDITERKATEQFLADSQLFSKALMQTAPVGLFVANPLGGCTYVNSRWSMQAGVSGAQAKGDGWQSRVHPDDRGAVMEAWAAFIRGETPFAGRRYRYLQGGKETWVDGSAVPLYDINQKVSGYLRIEQDVTERLQHERTIQGQQEKLASSAKLSSLGEMAGGVAHEINTPLAAIKTLSGQLQEVMEDESIDRALIKEMAAKVEKTTDRIAKIVKGLRAFSRDGSQDSFEAVNVGQLIEETLSFCGERFNNHGVSVTVEGFRKDLRLEGRATQISQVLLNLLNNACDAISGREGKWIRISVLETQDSVEIQVTDCGDGVPKEVQDRIFQPFFTTKEVGKGTGMGLSISAGIVKSHHGELRLDTSCPNTRFVIRLPKRQAAAEAA